MLGTARKQVIIQGRARRKERPSQVEKAKDQETRREASRKAKRPEGTPEGRPESQVRARRRVRRTRIPENRKEWEAT